MPLPVAAWDVPGLSDPLPLLLLETGTGKIKSRVGRYRLVHMDLVNRSHSAEARSEAVSPPTPNMLIPMNLKDTEEGRDFSF